jgi:CDP-glycerol glycerophosphotransferase (TagB/SpsB family)
MYLYASTLRGKGYRIAYITYGIEIVKTKAAEMDHFQRQVVQNAWKVYTFSPTMRQDYLRYVSPSVVKALGHPKFDRLYDQSIPKDRALLSAADGRKIVLLKLHWPKTEGDIAYSPDLSVYVDLLNHLPVFDDLFFAVMPHPNFFYNVKKHHPDKARLTEEIRAMVEDAPNAALCMDSDYRPALVCADYVITDRSAVMVEAGVLGVPVMYMTGKDWEPLNDAVAPIVLSYYQGQTCEDMLRFLEMCRKGHDPKRAERHAAVAEWIPFFDGKAGERIAKDMVEGVIAGEYRERFDSGRDGEAHRIGESQSVA